MPRTPFPSGARAGTTRPSAESVGAAAPVSRVVTVLGLGPRGRLPALLPPSAGFINTRGRSGGAGESGRAPRRGLLTCCLPDRGTVGGRHTLTRQGQAACRGLGWVSQASPPKRDHAWWG